MRTPRFRRLGLLGVATTIGLVAAVLSPAAAAGPTSYAPGLTMSKVWSGSVDNGGTATSTITLDNTGGGNVLQTNVVVVDTYDPGLTYGSFTISNGVGSCANDTTPGFRRVVCSGMTVPAGTSVTIALDFTGEYWGYPVYTKKHVTDERLDIQKAETHVDVQSGQTVAYSVHCPGGYQLLDHSFVLQHVDQDTGDFSDVYLENRTVNNTSATYTFYNDAGGKAQGKLWAVCVKNTTNHGQTVQFTGQYSSSETLVPTGPHERPLYAECDPGYTPVGINVRAVPNGSTDPDSTTMDDLFHQTGLEADGSRRARVWVVVRDHAQFTLQWRCLNTKIGTKRMVFGVNTDTVHNVPMHDKVVQKKITCDHHRKGIIGGWRGGKFNGSEPQPISRVYWLWHDGPGTKNFTGKLLCLKKRLVRGGKLKKDGTVTDQLWNHVFGTTQNHGFYIYNAAEVATTVTQD